MSDNELQSAWEIIYGASPFTFKGWWYDGDEVDIPEPWETFTAMVHGEEAGDVRSLLPQDLPALMEAIGAKREYVYADEKDPGFQGWVWTWKEKR